MGILADIFVATRADALRYEELLTNDGDMSPFERVEYKSLTGLEFGTLWAILEGAEWDVDRHMLATIDTGSEETWLEEFPAQLVEVLAAIDEKQIAKIASAWGKTEEVSSPGSALEPIIRDLRRLAKLSRSTRKPMFLWGSL